MTPVNDHFKNVLLKVIIGAGQQSYKGWIPTHKEQLDLLRREDWVELFGERRIDALLCEHVWEHRLEFRILTRCRRNPHSISLS